MRLGVRMENITYSLNATTPVFLTIVIGYVLKKTGLFQGNFIAVANKFNFNVTLPALLFQDIARTDIREFFDLRFMAFCVIATTICFWSIWGITKKVMKDKSMIGAFVQASFRGSAAVLGIALIQNVYGNSVMAPLMIVSSVPLYNIYSVIVLTFEASNEEEKNIKNAFRSICKNPIIIGIILGAAASLLHLKFPVFIDKTISNMASIATPLALIVIGAGFEGKKALAKIKPTMIASFIKLILQTAVFLPLAVWMGFRGEKLLCLIVMLAAPTTVSCYIMARDMKNDEVLTSSVIVTTTLLSAFTVTGWICITKALGLIG